MTYAEYIQKSADTAKNSYLVITWHRSFDCEWWSIRGDWYGDCVEGVQGSNYKDMCGSLRAKHGISIPRKKDLIFSRQRGGVMYAMIQGGFEDKSGCVVDMSEYIPPRKERT